MRPPMWTSLLLFSIAAAPTLTLDTLGKREVGQLVMYGIPDIKSELAARTLPYQNTRGASFEGFAPKGGEILISTRFAQVSQVHSVAQPLGARKQLTFFNEPISVAAYDQQVSGGFYFSMDTGGAERYQLHWFDRVRGTARLLTDGKSRHESLQPNRGGNAFAYVSTRRNNKDFDVYVQPTNGDVKDAKLVMQAEGQWHVLDWSLNDRQLLVRHYVSANESELWIVDVASGQREQLDKRAQATAYRTAVFSGPNQVLLASDADNELTRLFVYDLGTKQSRAVTSPVVGDVEQLATRNGKLAFTINEGGNAALFLGDVSAPEKSKRVTLPLGVISGLQFDAAAKRLGFSHNGATSPSDVYVVDVGSRSVTRWTESEIGGVDSGTLVEPKLVQFPSFDGRVIPAWLYQPKGKKSAPVIINIHGGPESQSRPSFDAMAQFLVNELGFAVIYPNVRGSTGYGKSYLQLDNGAKREDSVRDIGALLDWLKTQPSLDAQRVAVMGGSYGGYMTLASLVHFSDRLSCGVDVVGISNFVTFLNNTEDYRRDLRRVEYGDERDPKMKELLEKISPLNNADKIKRPLFVIQGLNDPRVPASEAEQIVTKVAAQPNARVSYLLAKDEGHGFKKKGNRDFQLNAIAGFLDTCLGGAR